ncbi:hypothetical protein TUM4249_13570 [Shewanella sp. KT0246]|nr:hypothetical protein TUM4249_13570 [Shewanella sp. KT0246]
MRKSQGIKSTLPDKICLVCQRPFSWRKKWKRDWPNVKFCSKRCAGERRSVNASLAKTLPANSLLVNTKLTKAELANKPLVKKETS